MKKLFPILLLFLLTTNTQAQFIIDTNWCHQNTMNIAYIDSTYTLCDSSLNIIIENTANNIWQQGKTIKFGTASIRDTSCAIMTDSLNNYTDNNTSAFYFYLPPMANQYYNYYVSFWHKYVTDSLMDGCWLEFSNDSGATWFPSDSMNLNGFINLDNNYNSCNLYQTNITQTQFLTLSNGKPAWSGNSNGWIHTSMWLNLSFPIKPERNGQINAIRFVFKSDSINTNKSGWIIDNFELGHIFVWGSVNNYKQFNKLPIYPNPSENIFTISLPNSYSKGKMLVYDIYGRSIIDSDLKTQIDLTNFQSGLYYYKISFDKTIYTGVLNKN